MSLEANAETRKMLTNEINALQAQCEEHCRMADNAPLEINSRNSESKNLNYLNNLAKTIQHEETPIITDSNVNTSLFLQELSEKIVQVEELTAFTRGAVQDVEKENERLRASIQLVQEAKARPWSGRREVLPEHLQQARMRFHTMKSEIRGLIHSLFPAASEAMISLLGELMNEKLNGESSGYIAIAPENYHLIELLKDQNVVSINPYNKMEVKLAY